MSGFAKPVEALIIERDQGCCVRCGRHVVHLERGRAWSIHHRRPRGAGGTSLSWVNRAANGVVLCGSGTTGCHGWVERERTKAFDAGFLVSKFGPAMATTTRLKHHLYGWVLLDNDGGYKPADDYGDEWAKPAAPSTGKDVT